MIILILTYEARLRDSLIEFLQLEKDTHNTTPVRKVYRKGSWICAYIEEWCTLQNIEEVCTLFAPELLILPFFGFSVSSQHHVGDIIVPHTLLTYNPLIQEKDFTREHHNTLLGEATFLDIWDQKDYHIENYGLSLGGIAVDRVVVEDTEQFAFALDFTYEADIYTTDDISSRVTFALSWKCSTYVIGCVTVAKKNPENLSVNQLGEHLIISIDFLLDRAAESSDSWA